MSDWVERGIEPLSTSNYKVEDGQVLIPEKAEERRGIQPTVVLQSKGQKCVHVRAGEEVIFEAKVETIPGSGKVTSAQWSFEGEENFPYEGKILLSDNGTQAVLTNTHTFTEKGTYFVVVRVNVQRNGNVDDFYTQVKNLDRMRVIVEE